MPAEGSAAGSGRVCSKPWTSWTSAAGVPNRITVGSDSSDIAALRAAARTTISGVPGGRSSTGDRTRNRNPTAAVAPTTSRARPTLMGEARLGADHGQDQSRGISGGVVHGDAIGLRGRGDDFQGAGLEVAREVGKKRAADHQPQPVAFAERIARH